MAKYKLYYLLILLILFSSCHQNQSIKNLQNQNNDSIEAYLKLAQNDTLGFEKRNEYNDKAFSFIDLKKEDEKTINYLFELSDCYGKTYNWDPFIRINKIILKKTERNNNDLNKARVFKNLGVYYTFQSKNDSALEYEIKAKKIYENHSKIYELILVLEDICLIQTYQCDFLGSNKTAIEAIKLKESNDTKNDVDFLYSMIGLNSSNLNDYEKAIYYYNMSEKIKSNKTNIGFCLIKLKKFNSAEKLLKEILSDKTEVKRNPENYSSALNNLALLKIESNKISGVKCLLDKSAKLVKLNKLENTFNYNRLYYSIYFSKLKDTINSIKYAKKALALSKQYKNPNDVLISLKQLIQVDPINAAQYAQDFINLNDSLQQAERRFRDKFAQIAFETEKIKKEKEEAELKIGYIVGVSLIITSLLLILYLLNYKRVKDKELELILLEQNTNEAKYHMILEQKKQENEIRQNVKNKIALELHDGVMNNLVSTRLNLMILQQKQDSETVKECIDYIKNIQIIENNIRNLAHNLNYTPVEDNKSLLELLQNHINEQNKLTTTQYTLEWDTKIISDNLTEYYTQQIYRIVQEATQNINKHAQAKKATIVLLLDNGNLCLSIMDNGIGFDITQVGTGIGLNNLEQRVANLNGKLTINSFPNENTFINISIPL
jgi:signal transduction histidine kinase